MDLNLISANVNRLLTNIWAVISFLREFAVDGAKDVSITYINSDGSESVKTFPNIAKMVSTYNITNDNGKIRDMNGIILTDSTRMTTFIVQGDITISGVTAGSYVDVKSFTYTPKYDNSTIYVIADITKPTSYSDVSRLALDGSLVTGDQVSESIRFGSLWGKWTNSSLNNRILTLSMRRVGDSDGDVKLYDLYIQVIEKRN